MHNFDRETRVSEIAPGQWGGCIYPDWRIGDNPNGGYLIACCTSALRKVVKHQQPLSITTHFLRPGVSGDFVVLIDVIKTGRSFTTVQASLWQENKQRLAIIATYGELNALPGRPSGTDTELLIPAVDLPAPDNCVRRSGEAQGIELPILNRVDVLLHPQQSCVGQNTAAELSGWIRFTDGREPDVESLIVFADAFPPSPYAKLGAVGWVPTLELTVHIRRKPEPGWIRAKFWTEDLQDGRMIENGLLWDSGGHLVAQSRQLGLLMER